MHTSHGPGSLVPHSFTCTHTYRITILGTGARWLAALEERGVCPQETNSLSSLHTILSTGSPLKPQSYDYVYSCIKQDVLLGSITGELPPSLLLTPPLEHLLMICLCCFYHQVAQTLSPVLLARTRYYQSTEGKSRHGTWAWRWSAGMKMVSVLHVSVT